MPDSDPLEANWKAFENLQEIMTAGHMGPTALLHDGELITIYNDSGDAYQIGVERFGAGRFSIQTFDEVPKSPGLLATCGQLPGGTVPTFAKEIATTRSEISIALLGGGQTRTAEMPFGV